MIAIIVHTEDIETKEVEMDSQPRVRGPGGVEIRQNSLERDLGKFSVLGLLVQYSGWSNNCNPLYRRQKSVQPLSVIPKCLNSRAS